MTQRMQAAGIFLCFFLNQLAFGQGEKKEFLFERLINQYVGAYAFSADNQFKLAAYAELKGRFDEVHQGFELPFGNLGKLAFYPNHCLLKTSRQQVYYLDRDQSNPAQSEAFNEVLAGIFEQIDLLGNCGAREDHVAFVNKWLAKKNMEPFDKIFTRHLFLKYGRLDPVGTRIEFHTDWLPSEVTSEALNEKSLVRYTSRTPLKLLLDSVNLRGYYIRIGGYVYIEDVKRSVAYASGEEYTYNGSAFKLFIQKMMTRSAQYIAEPDNSQASPQAFLASTTTQWADLSPQGVSRGEAAPIRPAAIPSYPSRPTQIKPLYDDYSWIPMMLSLLKSNNASITDPDVIIYFIDQPFFPRLYEMLPEEERRKIDRL